MQYHFTNQHYFTLFPINKVASCIFFCFDDAQNYLVATINYRIILVFFARFVYIFGKFKNNSVDKTSHDFTVLSFFGLYEYETQVRIPEYPHKSLWISQHSIRSLRLGWTAWGKLWTKDQQPTVHTDRDREITRI